MTPAASPRRVALSPTALREQVLPAHAGQVRVARAFIAAVLTACPAADDAVLCVSVRAVIFDDCVRIEVEDNGGAWSELPHRDNRSHGLDIVRELAADCGRDGSPLTGWVAWARLQWRRT